MRGRILGRFMASLFAIKEGLVWSLYISSRLNWTTNKDSRAPARSDVVQSDGGILQSRLILQEIGEEEFLIVKLYEDPTHVLRMWMKCESF